MLCVFMFTVYVSLIEIWSMWNRDSEVSIIPYSHSLLVSVCLCVYSGWKFDMNECWFTHEKVLILVLAYDLDSNKSNVELHRGILIEKKHFGFLHNLYTEYLCLFIRKYFCASPPHKRNMYNFTSRFIHVWFSLLLLFNCPIWLDKIKCDI